MSQGRAPRSRRERRRWWMWIWVWRFRRWGTGAVITTLRMRRLLLRPLSNPLWWDRIRPLGPSPLRSGLFNHDLCVGGILSVFFSSCSFIQILCGTCVLIQDLFRNVNEMLISEALRWSRSSQSHPWIRGPCQYVCMYMYVCIYGKMDRWIETTRMRGTVEGRIRSKIVCRGYQFPQTITFSLTLGEIWEKRCKMQEREEKNPFY